MTKSILITGASSGIGFCAAQCLRERGYRVFASIRQDADFQRLNNLGLEAILLDVTDSLSIQAAFKLILEKTGGTLDAVFNNAGYIQAGAVEDLTRQAMRDQFETNVFGAMEVVNQIIPIMRRQGHGRIIQNTSILGSVAMPFRGAYVASKYALEGFSNTLRQELKGTGIFVSIIAPGPIQSKLRASAHLHFKNHIANRPSVHQKLYRSMEKYFNADGLEKGFSGPQAVVKQLIHALESKKPHAHYYTGFPAKVLAFLKRILPETLLDSLLIKLVEDEKKSS